MIDNTQPFNEGQYVVCIKDNFPKIITTNKDKSTLGQKAVFHPQKNEELIIDEILGPFLRFNKYDSDDFGFQWWHHSSFAPIENNINRLKTLYAEEIKNINN